MTMMMTIQKVEEGWKEEGVYNTPALTLALVLALVTPMSRFDSLLLSLCHFPPRGRRSHTLKDNRFIDDGRMKGWVRAYL